MSFAKSFEHNQALFEAAIAEFARAGYDQASINTILQQAGMSKGQFYYHFENKRGLYLALIEILIERKQAFLAEVLDPELFGQDIFTIFQTQIRQGLAFTAAEPRIEAFSQAFLREKSSDIYEAALERFNFQDNAALNQLIERAYERGEFQEHLPLPFVQQLVAYLFSHISELVDLSGSENQAENLELLIDFIKNGLARRS